MLITKDFVFIHLPKTGGDFIRTLCKQNLPEGLDHPRRPGQARRRRPGPGRLRRPAPLRAHPQPWSWYVSWYHYHLGSGRTEEHIARVSNPVWTYVTEDGTDFDFERIVTKLVTG